MQSDLRTMRARHGAAAADLDAAQAGGDELGSAAGIGTTTTDGSYPTTANVCYAIQPCDVSGEESEGSTATFTALSADTIYAFNVGAAVPPQNTPVVWEAVGGRRVFRYDG